MVLQIDENEATMTIREYSTRSDGSAASGDDVAMHIEGSWDRTDWQRMWLCTQRHDWRTLALVPGDEETSTFDVANLIARLALDHGESIHVADLRALRLQHVDAFLEGSRWDVRQGDRVIFATQSASVNLATVPLARAADCAILCVSLGATRLENVRDSVEQIGREHFLGSLLVRASTDSDSRNRALSRRERSALKARQ
jgi:hypothetical protein